MAKLKYGTRSSFFSSCKHTQLLTNAPHKHREEQEEEEEEEDP